MKRVSGLAFLTATSMSLGLGACSSFESKNPSPTPSTVVEDGIAKLAELTLIATDDAQIYDAPGRRSELDKTPVRIKAGQSVVAYCYHESATIGADSLGITKPTDGYVFVFLPDSAGKPVDQFDIPYKVASIALARCEQ